METVIYILIIIMSVLTASYIAWRSGRSSCLSVEKDFVAYRSASEVKTDSLIEKLSEKTDELLKAKEEIRYRSEELEKKSAELAAAYAENRMISEKLSDQKKDLEKLGEKFRSEFENMANRIMENKSEKFTELNRNNLKSILDPLGSNIEAFKKLVSETYEKESKQRFSLAEKVKELSELNKVISDEAKNLTNALKTQSKTRGIWGEMILESILESSGLRKGVEYFTEYQLTDKDGNALRSDTANKKMRPDAIIKYPDNRTIVIDSKVSLNAFANYCSATEPEEQESELSRHVEAVKNRISELSGKGYDDYYKTLDFVMMFIPSESAYIAALQGDKDIWNYAYNKRVLLINPTNLIISLKLIHDLWKREYQNENALAIAERGAKLYDKFVGFIENLQEVEKNIDKSKNACSEALKQLSTGRDNLVLQTTKLKDLGLKTKKNIADNLLEDALTDEQTLS